MALKSHSIWVCFIWGLLSLHTPRCYIKHVVYLFLSPWLSLFSINTVHSPGPDAALDADSLSIDGFGFIMQLTHTYKQIHKRACSSSVSPLLNIWYARSQFPFNLLHKELISLHTLKQFNFFNAFPIFLKIKLFSSSENGNVLLLEV